MYLLKSKKTIFAAAFNLLAIFSLDAYADCSTGSITTTQLSYCFVTTPSLTVTNSGSILTPTGDFSVVVHNLDLTGGITNNNIISNTNGGGGDAMWINSSTINGGIVNSGALVSGTYGIYVTDTATINGGIVNSGTGTGLGSIPAYGGGTYSIAYGIYGGWSAITIWGTVNGGILNSGTMYSNVWGIAVAGNAVINDGITNLGSITSYQPISVVNSTAVVAGGITNGSPTNSSASLIALNNGNAIYNAGNIDFIKNYAVMTGGNDVTSTNASGIYNETGASIGSITNYQGGVISNTSGVAGFGIYNNGTITTLNNAQGAGNAAGALTYSGNLPANYNIIINSPTSFGKLAVTGGVGSTNFGIYSASKVHNGTYTSVLTGLTSSNLTTTSGTIGSGSWLLSNSSGSIWDLIVSDYIEPIVVPLGPSVANTNQSLMNTASVLQGTYTLQNSVLANSFSYDCNVFGANNVCVSAGGRNTALQAANGLNNTSALLIAAYRLNQNYRIGAYADQNLSVSNPGGTVNLGNNTPLIGLFGAWNERLDGTGIELKVSAAYGQKNTSITRSVVGSGTGASEAGSGSSTLNSQGAQATTKYGFAVMDKVIVSPYIGVRYTQNNMGGYTEATSSTVTATLTYSALNTNATTALAGVGASYKVMPTVTTFASAGVETDTSTANGTYAATNASIGALTPVNFNANPVRTRPTATLGAYYDIAKNQRFGVTGIYRQEPYQAVSTTTVMATYTVGL